jgi:hypothetical protein
LRHLKFFKGIIMTKQPSERRLVENELIFRRLNEQVQRDIDDHNRMAADEGQDGMQIDGDGLSLHFYCECSDVLCTQRIAMSQDEYRRQHVQRDHFTVIPGHDIAAIERIIEKYPHYYLIQKFSVPPKALTV